MKWISVEDELPASYQEVLIYDGNDYYIGYIDNRNMWYIAKNVLISTSYEIEDVTHWMPLSKPEDD
jgi:hypothetical protein